MTHILWRKVQYVGSIGALVTVVCGPLLWFQAPPWSWMVVGLTLLIPGRIAGHYYRDLFAGRRLMDARRFSEAIPLFERFLQRIRTRPELKRLIWLTAGIYTRDVEAMALNNLGGAQLEIGKLDHAESPLRQALLIDPDYPLPYVNLAHLALLRGDLEEAARSSSAAKRLGYHDTRVDALIHGASGTLAAVEGRSKVSN